MLAVNKDSKKHSIQELVTDNKSERLIIKGVKLTANRSNPKIVYIMAIGNKTRALQSEFNNKDSIQITKNNKSRKTVFKFNAWDKICCSNGQLTGTNMNMFNDVNKYELYIVD